MALIQTGWWIQFAFADASLGPLGPTLTILNGRIEAVDPKRYYGRISALESTAEGIRILKKHRRCSRHQKHRLCQSLLHQAQRKFWGGFKSTLWNQASRWCERANITFLHNVNRVNAMIPKPNTATARKFMRRSTRGSCTWCKLSFCVVFKCLKIKFQKINVYIYIF